MEQIQRGPMSGTTMLVTGVSSGIGKATALGLARMSAHLAITGRDRARIEFAADEIRTGSGGKVEVSIADLSAQPKVRHLAVEVLQRLPRRCNTSWPLCDRDVRKHSFPIAQSGSSSPARVGSGARRI